MPHVDQLFAVKITGVTYIYIYYIYNISYHPSPWLSIFPSSPMSTFEPLPAYLDLPPHLSAHKYFLVCTLTVAAWDALVLTPRSWRLTKSSGWPILKVLFHFLRVFMPIEFVIVGAFCLLFSLALHLQLFQPWHFLIQSGPRR